MEKKEKMNIEKLKNVVIIILSLIIVFGIAFVVPELKECGSCKEEQLGLTEINATEYKELLNGEEVSLIYIASPTCGYCAQQEPIMKQLVNEYGVTVNYLNISAVTDAEGDAVYNSYASMQMEEYQLDGVRTPTILLVQKGKVIDMNLGSMSLDNLVKFVKNYIEITEE